MSAWVSYETQLTVRNINLEKPYSLKYVEDI